MLILFIFFRRHKVMFSKNPPELSLSELIPLFNTICHEVSKRENKKKPEDLFNFIIQHHLQLEEVIPWMFSKTNNAIHYWTGTSEAQSRWESIPFENTINSLRDNSSLINFFYALWFESASVYKGV